MESHWKCRESLPINDFRTTQPVERMQNLCAGEYGVEQHSAQVILSQRVILGDGHLH